MGITKWPMCKAQVREHCFPWKLAGAGIVDHPSIPSVEEAIPRKSERAFQGPSNSI